MGLEKVGTIHGTQKLVNVRRVKKEILIIIADHAE